MGKREDILEATRDLVAEEGIHAFSYPKIFERAGVGSGTVYHYFEGKEALLVATYRQALTTMDAEVLAGYDPEASVPLRFAALVRNTVRFVSLRWKDLAVLEACGHLPVLAEEKLRRTPPSAAATFALLADGRAQGYFLPLDPMMVSSMLMGAVTSLVEGHRNGKYVLDDGALDQVVAACWRAVAAPERAAFPPPLTAGSDSSRSPS